MATKFIERQDAKNIKIVIEILFSFVNLAETGTNILNTATKAKVPFLELRTMNLVGEIGGNIKTAIERGTRGPKEPKPCGA